jgi:hypothetical protein
MVFVICFCAGSDLSVIEKHQSCIDFFRRFDYLMFRKTIRRRINYGEYIFLLLRRRQKRQEEKLCRLRETAGLLYRGNTSGVPDLSSDEAGQRGL